MDRQPHDYSAMAFAQQQQQAANIQQQQQQQQFGFHPQHQQFPPSVHGPPFIPPHPSMQPYPFHHMQQGQLHPHPPHPHLLHLQQQQQLNPSFPPHMPPHIVPSPFRGSYDSPPPAPPPSDPELQKCIDKLVEYAAKHGPEFEAMVRENQKDNPAYRFLFGGEGHNYYRYTLWLATRPPGGPFNPPFPSTSIPVMHPPNPMVSPSPPNDPKLNASGVGPGATSSLLNVPQMHQPPFPPFYDQQHSQPFPGTMGGPGRQHYDQSSGAFKGLSGPLPSDVAMELNNVLNGLTGTKESIKGAKLWFMQRSPFAPALAEALRDRVFAVDDSERQLHILFLSNDILFDRSESLLELMAMSNATWTELMAMSNATCPSHVALDMAINSSSDSDLRARICSDDYLKYAVIECYKSLKLILDEVVVDEDDMTGDGPFSTAVILQDMFEIVTRDMMVIETCETGRVRDCGWQLSDKSDEPGDNLIPPAREAQWIEQVPLSLKYIICEIYVGNLSLQRRTNTHDLSNEALAFRPVLGSILARIYHNPQNKEENQERLQKVLQFWASKEVYDRDTIRLLESEMIGGVPTNSFTGHPQRDFSSVSADASTFSGLPHQTSNHNVLHWQSDKQNFSDQERLENQVPSLSAMPQQFLQNSSPAGSFPGAIPMLSSAQPTNLQSAPHLLPAQTSNIGEKLPPYPLFPPGLIPGMVRKMQIGSGVPYSPMSPLDIPTMIPPSTTSPSELLERVSKFFREIGEVNPSEGPLNSADDDDEYERDSPVRKGGTCIPPPPNLQVDPETGTLPDGSVERKPGSVSSGRLGLGATANPNEASQYDDVYSSYRKQRSTNYHTSMSARSATTTTR